MPRMTSHASARSDQGPRLPAPLLLACVVIVALWFRWPFVSSGLPYFYHEDEAHHFNRVVEMVKNGEWNPHYFHKPSLHFYLRIPVVAASFLWGVKEGHLRSVKEIRTRDPYGLAGYAFTASHPGIVKWNRAFSVLLSVGVVALVFLLVFELTGTRAGACAGGLLCAFSPELVSSAGVIGVDVPMMFLCLLTVLVSVRALHCRSALLLATSALLAGLAISTKYNALPIAAVPLAAWAALASTFAVRGLVAVMFLVPAGFLLGSPFILASFPLFLDQFAYEIWHYGIAGHEGHTGEPGWAQALFYWGWLRTDALGIVALLGACVGILAAIWRGFRTELLTLLFPALFFLLMCEQRANFVRNMYVVVPFFAVFFGIALAVFLDALRTRATRWRAIVAIVVGLAVFSPVREALARRAEARSWHDSREEVAATLVRDTASVDAAHATDTAVVGELQLRPEIYRRPGVSPVSEDSLSLEDLYLRGFDRVVWRGGGSSHAEIVEVVREISGERGAQRVPRNPAMEIVSFRPWKEIREPILTALARAPEQHGLTFSRTSNEQARCEAPEPFVDEVSGRRYCWTSSRLTPITIAGVAPRGDLTVSLALMTPWPYQEIEFSMGRWAHSLAIPPEDAGHWIDLTLSIPAAARGESDLLMIRTEEVHSPASYGLNEDRRRLGVALEVKTVEQR